MESIKYWDDKSETDYPSWFRSIPPYLMMTLHSHQRDGGWNLGIGHSRNLIKQSPFTVRTAASLCRGQLRGIGWWEESHLPEGILWSVVSFFCDVKTGIPHMRCDWYMYEGCIQLVLYNNSVDIMLVGVNGPANVFLVCVQPQYLAPPLIQIIYKVPASTTALYRNLPVSLVKYVRWQWAQLTSFAFLVCWHWWFRLHLLCLSHVTRMSVCDTCCEWKLCLLHKL